MHPTSYLEQYFEPFREWLSRDDIVELAINPNGEVWVEMAGDAAMRPAGKRVEAKAASASLHPKPRVSSNLRSSLVRRYP